MNPGIEGVNLVPSVSVVCERYKNFLKSPVDGYWRDDEIIELPRLRRAGLSLYADFLEK